ncbi:MAG: Fic/DOC family N-terminal domain-containing protein [Thermodesulfobacteriota bacterium]
MEKTFFTENSPGELVKISIQESDDWAFVPDHLPTDFQVSGNLWPLLAEAREELARLDGVGRHMPNYNLLLKPLQHREALKSSSLEGTYATPEELLLFEIEPKEPKSNKDKINSWKEVFNYHEALIKGQQLLSEIPVSLRFLREIHKVLLSGVRGHHRDPGNFRRSQVHVGSDKRFIPPPPDKLEGNLFDLEKYIHQESSIDPLVFCFFVHYQFETIHPFLDGNGRVGRLLLSLMIFHWCKLTSPWLYLSAFFDKYKEEYIQNLFNVSAKGDFDTWIAYCLRATIYQAKDAIKRFDQLVAVRERYLQMVANCKGSIRLHGIIERLFESPLITIPQATEIFEITYPTARNDLSILEKLGIIRESRASTRPKVYISPEIFAIAYSDVD